MNNIIKIAEIITPSLDDMGFEIVRIRLLGTVRVTLQIMADRKDDYPISVDDCAVISHHVSTLLDVEDPISSAYRLEISSPGIDRPLIKLGDFAKWAGFEARITLKWLMDGRKRFQGHLLGVEGDKVLIQDDRKQTFALAFEQIDEAKLIMNDKLLKASQEKARALGLAHGVEGGHAD